jgi:hypothetical protein
VEEDVVGGTCSAQEERRTVYRLLVGYSEGKRPVRKPGRRWVDNSKMIRIDIGWGGIDWIGLAQDMYRWRTPVNAVTKLQVL